MSSYNILGEFFIMWLSATPPDLWIEETIKRCIVPTEQVSSTRYRPLAKKKTKPLKKKKETKTGQNKTKKN